MDFCRDNEFERGARYLMRENLKVVWAEFSTLSLAVWLVLHGKCLPYLRHILEWKTRPRLHPVSSSLSMVLDIEKNLTIYRKAYLGANSSTVVEQLTHNPKTVGLNTATCTVSE